MVKSMKHKLLILLLGICSITLYAQSTIENDSLAVRELLTANGFYFLPVENFARYEGNRIVSLRFIGNKSTAKNVPDFIYIIPASINKLTKLRKLEISSCKFDSIPEVLFNFPALDTLIFYNNQTVYVGESLGKLKNLKFLDISMNQINQLPGSIGYLKDLVELRMAINKFSSVPEQIGNLTKLVYMDIGHCKLSTLPSSFATLQKIERLILGNNSFTLIPEAIMQIRGIKNIYLENNIISQVPPTIKNLTKLSTLNLENNRISDIPPELFQLSSVESLNLSRNLICGYDTLIDRFHKLSNKLELKIGEQICNNSKPFLRRISSWIPVKIDGKVSEDSTIAAELIHSFNFTIINQRNLRDNKIPGFNKSVLENAFIDIEIDSAGLYKKSYSGDPDWSPVLIRVEMRFNEPFYNTFRYCEYFENVFKEIIDEKIAQKKAELEECKKNK